MKPFRSILVIFFLVLILSLSVQAAPRMGTYIAPDSFLPGTWEELLIDGKEGKEGNVISAQSEGYFLLKGLTLKSVNPTDPSLLENCDGGSLAFETFYEKGDLTLNNITPKAPWRVSGDPATYEVLLPQLPQTTVKTCKFMGGGIETGEISFHLTSKGVFKDYPEYTAEIEATYQGKPDFSQVNNDIKMTDLLEGAKITIKGPVAVDIKPGSCPNPVNVKSRGVLPVAILGGPNLDVRNIDPATITLAGVHPLRWAIEHVGTPFNPSLPKDDRLDCNTTGDDGFPDLTLKFETQALVEKLKLTAAPDKSIQVWSLTFNLEDDTELTGSDVVWILNNEPKGNPYQFRRTKQKK